MSTIAIIPARAGSKRIPRKNIRIFLDKPIIAYSIQAAKESGLFDRIIVSTDSDEIADIARRLGAEVPFRRPEHLANDVASINDVLLHAINWLKENGGCDIACCIYPTAPLIEQTFLRKGCELLKQRDFTAVISVARFSYPIYRALKLDSNKIVEMIWPQHSSSRSQDLPETYHDAAQFIWLYADSFLLRRDIWSGKTAAVILPSRLVQDIDTFEDWEEAESKFRVRRRLLSAKASSVYDLAVTATPLVLGTAQLGSAYGIANRHGKPDGYTANEILSTAWEGGIRAFDTAEIYGDSENVLGSFITDSVKRSEARLISKLAPGVNTGNALEIRCRVEDMLRRLNTESIWALLLHREIHFDEWNGVLGETLRKLRQEGLVKHLGLSVYNLDYARRGLMNPDIEIVEIPANLFDRRMKRSDCNQLAQDNRKLVLVRSIFLQGLILMNPTDVARIVPRGAEAVCALRTFCRDHGLNPREFSYDYARASYPGAMIVIGAETPEQVLENCHLIERAPIDERLIEAWDEVWPEDIVELYDPSRWGKASQTLGPCD